MRTTFLLLLAALPALATDYPDPEKTRPDEPLAKAYSSTAAAAYLDAVGVNWTRDRACITCHTNLPYLMARPAHKADDAGWKEVRTFLEKDVARWQDGGKPRGDAFIVATAAGLAFTDAHTGGKLSPATNAAFEQMWAAQKPTGEWNWIKCNWPPLEHDDYYGATLAAVAVAVAPDDYRRSDAAKPGLDKLRNYFADTPAPDLHHKVMLLWAATKIDGLMSAEEQNKTIADLKAKQRADGGWCLPSFGTYSRRDKSANDPNAASDGYATGLAVYVLRQSGMEADNPVIAKGVNWLKANQRESGRWYTRSLNNDKAHYISNAGTAFAVLALASCGEAAASR